jgi:maltooligosyltrehalose trehalohydrolase
MPVAHKKRRLSAGVELLEDGTAHARVWAPRCRTVDVVLEGAGRAAANVRLARESDGFHSGELANVVAGDRYWFRLDDDRNRPDPVSRWQPDGPHGPSAIVDPASFAWTDGAWRGVTQAGQVIYELHVGTFTPEGTWAAAAERLSHLADVGITVIEMMPVADFAGRWGWGYDGVNLYAPTRLYGTPDDLRRFIDRAHALGIGVILDVVYNHLGPDGNYLGDFSDDYVTDRYKNDWGASLNFEGPRAARDFFAENAAYWVDEYHFDGIRLDATQDIHDASPEFLVAELTRRARAAAAPRSLYVVAENEPQDPLLVRAPESGGYGVDALLNDDFHHSALVALTGRREAYYTDYTGAPQELVSATKYGYLYQGQWYSWQEKPRGGSALDLPATRFVHFLENHDQVANSSLGKRIHQITSPGRWRAVTALTLLGPATPLIFQGEEFAASTPFLFFADHGGDLRDAIREGRRQFLQQFPSMQDPNVSGVLPLPDDPETFARCKLAWRERDRHHEALALHRDLLRLRRSDPGIASPGRVDGAVLGTHAFVLRYDVGGPNPRLLLVNLGAGVDLSPLPEPLLAPPTGMTWTVQWSSDAVVYGGAGDAPLHPHPEWRLHAESAVLLTPEPRVRGTVEDSHAGSTKGG